MSGFRCRYHDNVIFILLIFSLVTLTVCVEHNSSPQDQLDVTELRGHVPHDTEVVGTASERRIKDMLRIRRSADDEDQLTSFTASQAARHGHPAAARRHRRASAYQSPMSWLAARKSLPGAAVNDVDDDGKSWLNVVLRHLPADEQARILGKLSAASKRSETDSRRRSISGQEEDRDEDWNNNGWAGNNVRIWG